MFNYPLTLSFKLIAFNPQVKITDAAGQIVLYVKQKTLALREAVKVFADEVLLLQSIIMMVLLERSRG